MVGSLGAARSSGAGWRVSRRRALGLLGGAAGIGLADGAAPAGAAPFTDASVEDLGRRIHAVRRRFGFTYGLGVHIEHLLSRTTLFSYNEDRPYVPASGMKLPVMAACLYYLGPNYRFPTRLFVDRPPNAAGVVEGPLRIVGSGDPSLNHLDMEFIAESLAGAGISEVTGDFLLDDSFFEPQETDRELVQRRLRRREPIQSALGYEWNQVVVGGTPGAGPRPEVRDEGYGYYAVDNRMVLSNTGRPFVLARRRGARRIRLEGRILRGGDERLARFTATEPALYFGHALRGKLRERGVSAPGEVRRETRGASRGRELLHVHESAPLTQVVEALGKYSNNWSAEQLLFAVGAHRWGPPGTLEKGQRALEEYLVGLGFRADSFRIADGSGLSRENRLTPRLLVGVVQDLYRQPALRDDFLCSLAVSGVDGTLARRLRGPETLGRIIAKTGSLSSVSSLSGVVFPGDGEPLAFSVVTNGLREQWSGDAVENRIASELVRWGGAAT